MKKNEALIRRSIGRVFHQRQQHHHQPGLRSQEREWWQWRLNLTAFSLTSLRNFNGWENWQTSSQLERELRHWNLFPSSVGSALLVSAARVQLFFAFSTSLPTPHKRSVESSLYSHQINILHVLHSLIPDAELIVLPFSFVNFSFPSALRFFFTFTLSSAFGLWIVEENERESIDWFLVTWNLCRIQEQRCGSSSRLFESFLVRKKLGKRRTVIRAHTHYTLACAIEWVGDIFLWFLIRLIIIIISMHSLRRPVTRKASFHSRSTQILTIA